MLFNPFQTDGIPGIPHKKHESQDGPLHILRGHRLYLESLNILTPIDRTGSFLKK